MKYNNEVEFLPLANMLKRAEASKEESDTAYFYDLMSIGELVVKFTALFLVANIEDDVDRTRYRYEYRLVRADGIGEYSDIISEITTGSAANYLPRCVRDTEIVELNSRAIDDSWQGIALIEIGKVLNNLNIQGNSRTNKSSIKIWYSNFSILRNKTKGHGSITASQCTSIVQLLENSILSQ